MAQQTTTTKTKEGEEKTAGRPPVVVVLGHVDHGKSSLLEAIREDFRITGRESGGITQHIGAYEASYNGRKITFLDTPGHEAFSAMRSRGVKVADIALLVVAADDGVKPQTKEALSHIQAAGLPFIVVATKMDKPGASEDRVRQELLQEGVQVESFGGTVPFAAVSASTKQGIQELLELILLVAEMEQLQGDPAGPLEGVVVEAFLDARRGPAATVLLRQGRLLAGDPVATASAQGKARILEDFMGAGIQEALPGQPVLVLGWEKGPQVGEEVRSRGSGVPGGPEDHFPQAGESSPEEGAEEPPAVPIVLKADAAGSLEALQGELAKLPQERARLVLVQSGVGDIGEGDVKFAVGAGARVLGFRTKVRPEAASLAERFGVPVETFSVIYELLERAGELLEQQGGEPEPQAQGEVEVLRVFSKKRDEQVVGGVVRQGEIRKGIKAEVVRGEEVVGEGKVKNLQRNKEDVASVPAQEEFGMLFESPVPLQDGDVLRWYLS